jgi:hypothetical protein
MQLAGRNLGRLMREVFRMGTPRSLQGAWNAVSAALDARLSLGELIRSRWIHSVRVTVMILGSVWVPMSPVAINCPSSTGC